MTDRDQLRAELVRSFRAGKPHITITELAARHGCWPSTARRLLEEAGIRSDHHMLGLTDEEVSAAVVARFFHLGTSMVQLGAVTGLDHRRIRRCVRDADLDRHRLAMSIADLKAAYDAGASLRQLARRAGGRASYGIVRRALLDAGVELRPRGGPRNILPA